MHFQVLISQGKGIFLGGLLHEMGHSFRSDIYTAHIFIDHIINISFSAMCYYADINTVPLVCRVVHRCTAYSLCGPQDTKAIRGGLVTVRR